MEKSCISSEGYQLIKCYEQMRRNSDIVRWNQEKMKVFFDNCKNFFLILFQIFNCVIILVVKCVVMDYINGESVFVKRLDCLLIYFCVFIDKDDLIYVKVYK